MILKEGLIFFGEVNIFFFNFGLIERFVFKGFFVLVGVF